ncbi:MAG: hypothetical protein KJN93_04195 [Alphaproteobacteria bacterium]|nr:hypothetical protein [Alphaproteobacteria bacterium]NNF25227.1 hypothetical protein [Paracoccaceae bacterium]
MRFPIGFLRMAKWARRPPSEARVKLVLAILLVCALLWGAEQIFGFPQWLTPNMTGSGRIAR